MAITTIQCASCTYTLTVEHPTTGDNNNGRPVTQDNSTFWGSEARVIVTKSGGCSGTEYDQVESVLNGEVWQFGGGENLIFSSGQTFEWLTVDSTQDPRSNLSVGVTFSGDCAAFIQSVENALQTSLNNVFNAQSGTNYELDVVDVGGGSGQCGIQIRWKVKHNPSGLWCGFDFSNLPIQASVDGSVVNLSGGFIVDPSATFNTIWSGPCGDISWSGSVPDSVINQQFIGGSNYDEIVFAFNSDPFQYTNIQTGNNPLSCGDDMIVVHNATPESCDGACDGSITISVSGGSPPYTIAYASGPTTPTPSFYSGVGANQQVTFDDLCPGNYTFSVDDSEGCTGFTNPTLVESGQGITVNATNVNCDDIEVSFSGGTGPYEWRLDNGSWNDVLGNPFFILNRPPGTYEVFIRDSNGCIGSDTVTVTGGDDAPTCNASFPACPGCTYCTVFGSGLTASTPQNPVQYNWTATPSGGGSPITGSFFTDTNGSWAITQELSCCTTYTIEFTNTDNGCVSSCTTSTQCCPPLELAIDYDCSAEELTVTVSGGCGSGDDFYFALRTTDCNGAISQDNTQSGTTYTFTGVTPGDYCVEVTDTAGDPCPSNCGDCDGCTVSQAVTLTCGIDISCDGTAPTCNGDSDGDITGTVTGGVANYTYELHEGFDCADGTPTTVGPTASTSNTFTGLSAGNYSVKVTDSNGETSCCNYTLTDPTALNVSCSSNNDSITATGSGGTGPYDFDISADPNSDSCSAGNNAACNTNSYTFNSLPDGTYTVTITDTLGCTDTCSVTIDNAGPGPDLELNCIDPACNGDNGSIVVTAIGTGPFDFDISPDPNSDSCGGGTNPSACDQNSPFTFDNLPAGGYDVTVTDANGGTSTIGCALVEPDPLTITVNVNGDTINASASGGTPGYTFELYEGTCPASGSPTASNGTGTFPGLDGGDYCVVVVDSNGCEDSDDATIVSDLTVDCQITGEITCNGECDGEITATGDGGTPTYEYRIDGGAWGSSGVFTGLCAGIHVVDIRDSGSPQQTASCSVNITDPQALTIDVTVTGTDITVTVTGGTPNYTYELYEGACPSSGGTLSDSFGPTPQTSYTFGQLDAGEYCVNVTDANGCTVEEDAEIVAPDMECSASAIPETCQGACDGEIEVTVTGGTSPYTYEITGPEDRGPQNSATFSDLCPGTYTVTVTDDNGETCLTNVTVLDGTALIVNVQITVDDGGEGDTCTGVVTASGGTTPYEYKVTYEDGTVVGWQGTPTFTDLPPGLHEFCARDADGCEGCVTANCPAVDPPLEGEVTVTCATCFGECDGRIVVTASGGTPPYQYNINGGPWTFNNVFTGLCAGEYQIGIQDSEGEQIFIGPVDVCEPDELDFTYTVTCVEGGGEGIVTFTITGGTPTYTIRVNGIVVNNPATLPDGEYTVEIEDENGCTILGTIEVDCPEDPVECNGPTYGDVTTEIMLYDYDSTIFINGCVDNVAPCERVKMCATMDKASYNSRALANGIPGNFDTNFTGVSGGWAYDGINQEPTLFRPLRVTVTDNGDSVTACMEIRLLDGWEDSTRYFVFEWIFDAGVCTDVIYTPLQININPFEDVVNLVEVNGPNTSGLPDTICDTSGNYEFIFSKNFPGDYSLIPMIRISGTKWGEHNSYNNSNLERLFQPCIIESDPLFSSSNPSLVSVTIDGDCLPEGTCAELKMIIKKVIGGNTPPPADCTEDIGMTITATADNIIGGNNGGQIDWTLSYNIDPLSTGLAVVKISWNESTDEYITRGDESSTELNDSFFETLTYYGPVVPSGYLVTFNVIVELDDGCVYQGSVDVSVPGVAGQSDNGDVSF